MMPPVDDAPGTSDALGSRLVQASWAGTVLFAVVAGLAVVVDGLRTTAAVVDIVLFFVGIVAFLVAYARAIGRSRTELLGVGGIFFLSGSAPPRVQRLLLGALAAQTLLALVTASLRPYTPLAFGMLVPMYGLGLAGLWGAFLGSYPARGEPSASLPGDD
jgi:hypothetical protein